MTENLDVLLSIAEISVAFAGFSGIITAVVGRAALTGTKAIGRFRLMIFSICPQSLLHYTLRIPLNSTISTGYGAQAFLEFIC